MTTDNNNEDGAQKDYREGARNRKIFTTTDFILGLPSGIFMGCAAVLGAVFILFTWWAAIIMGLLIVPVMFHIHKDDPKALALWQAAMRQQHTAWEAGTCTRRELVILD